ncbi:uncharacterized protein AMSG_01303 [Thecamonas trahens ATCC 50062]|uniref:Uncharacterized protein n=1 Tax=Thecamonas trahens ATCC 50062 TaxID=461836 RepID=A0A0L0DQB8_THETB|nr:hypothetical protein AMSG_01303 [Thecamonas trahens ATCC 50062]KNC53593.1 hypothetical protein AMSG_01303 [Thecamonas trahens ATCC 50062]|eukprot:XP_013761910.1 hypothetical protein AMSG_01303 [Thecamonas trahens ATCC 50062]
MGEESSLTAALVEHHAKLVMDEARVQSAIQTAMRSALQNGREVVELEAREAVKMAAPDEIVEVVEVGDDSDADAEEEGNELEASTLDKEEEALLGDLFASFLQRKRTSESPASSAREVHRVRRKVRARSARLDDTFTSPARPYFEVHPDQV